MARIKNLEETMKQQKSVRCALLIGAVLTLTTTGATAAEFKLTASSSHPPVIPWVNVIKTYVVPESVKRAKALGHTIKWTEAYAGALYNFKNTLEGIEEGLGDVGWVGTLWEPVKLPLQNVTFSTPFVTADVAVAAEIQEEMHKNIPAMNEQWKKYKQVYLGPQTIDDYVLISNFPVKSIDDIKGRKLYSAGGMSRWIENSGAAGVDGGLPIYYNGIKTGIADGAIVPGTGILPFKLHEVAPYITTIGFGGGITGALTMNLTTWNKLPPELQEMFRQLGKEYGELVTKKVIENHEKHFKIMADQGAKFYTLPIEEQIRWSKTIPNIAKEWTERNQAKGLPANQVLSAYMDGVRKRGIKPIRDWDE